jgi:hypothetical protein
MSDFVSEGLDLEKLQKAVLDISPGKKRKDAPEFRLTGTTFPNNASILDSALNGDLGKAIKGYNSGGTYNPNSREFFGREFYLMRIFDYMEELGRAQFERYAPCLWDGILSLYYETFSRKIVKSSDKPKLGDLYGAEA